MSPSGSFYESGRYATDPCSKSGATKLADTIAKYWQAKGRRINVWVEESQYGMFVVRSDLRRGRPVSGPPKHSPWNFSRPALPRIRQHIAG